MIVLSLQCMDSHRFDGWFRSLEDYSKQVSDGKVRCPVCDNSAIRCLPAGPHVKKHGAGPREKESHVAAPKVDGTEVLRKLFERAISDSEDVGRRFAVEARKIYYDEAPTRNIRGVATPTEVRDLEDEGIEVLSLPMAPWRKTH